MGKTNIKNWGDFEIDFANPIGSGGMGIIYPARQISLSRQVAIKIVNKDYSIDNEMLAYFSKGLKKEIAALKTVRDSRLPGIIQAGQYNGTPWFAMERFTGETLHAIINRAPRSHDEAVGTGRQFGLARKAA